MRISATLALLTLSVSSPAASQSLPVRLRPPLVADTGAAGRAEDLLAAYLRKRFEALGVRIVKSDDVTAVEVNFSVLPIGVDYDIAAVLTMQNCSLPGRPGCSRGVATDWMHFHGYGDLEQAARELAENVYSELGPIADMLRTVDSIARAPKH